MCEELLYRGCLVWFLKPWLGLAGAYLGVIVLFGVGHLYQGRKGATRATLAGAAMTGFVALTRWLLPAMIIHALIDAGLGTVGDVILCDEHPPAEGSYLPEAQPVSG
jgi:membrane protease YdiL (CAAX protease family)